MCDFVKCEEESTTFRTVGSVHGTAFTANLCQNHAHALDKGEVMMVEHQVVPHEPLPAA